MIDEPATLTAAYERCRKLHAYHGRSFYLGTMLLPAWKRRHVSALYGFVRVADDLVDDMSLNLTGRQRMEAVQSWGGLLRAGLAGEPVDDPVLPAVVHTVRAFGIDPADLFLFVDAMAMDTAFAGYDTYEQLCGYMEGSAAAVGRAMTPIGEPSDLMAAREPGRQLGYAFQLTNFLRDVAEDLARGRVYLPAEDLKHFGVTQDDLAQAESPHRVRELIAFEVDRARAHYRAAEPGFDLFPPASRQAFRAAADLYGGILDEIERAGFNVLNRRVRVPRHRRAVLFARRLARAHLAHRRELRVPMPTISESAERIATPTPRLRAEG
ncbi:phytoene/squalene synthase family protein [Streptomyces monticola]|uniref:Phytoene/squalene synthase family protein n=1 Tax=Streptomyces monticola TaxID=2666263 RepID=A0ABW2JN03_9ACTN